MHGSSYFRADYVSAREDFRSRADRLGLARETHAIDARGALGEDLTIDVATFGPTDVRRTLLLTSGLHGVEGFLGSAVQIAWMDRMERGTTPPPGLKVILAHGLNPFGFSWDRRWNESNVDLNRNFIEDRSFLDDTPYRTSLAVYERINAFLNPPSSPSPREPYVLKAMSWALSEGWAARSRLPSHERPGAINLSALRALGLAELQKTLPVGQYHHPQGLFYGGNGPEATTRVIRDAIPRWMTDTDDLIHLDFHTGLGRFADLRLLIADGSGDEEAQRASSIFGAENIEPFAGPTAYKANGTLTGFVQALPSLRSCLSLTAEFGTYNGPRVLGALRAENRAHQYAEPGSAVYVWAKRGLREAFTPADPHWRDRVVARSLDLIDQSLAFLSN